MNDMTNVEQIANLLDKPDGAEVDMDDPNVLDAINKLSEGEAGDESGTSAPDTANEPEAKPEAKQEAAKAQEQEKVILSKDGKHQIPFDVLEQSRANEEAAIAAARQLAAVVQSLEAEIAKKGQEPAAKGSEVPSLRARLDQARAAVDETAKEYPDIAPAQKAILDSMVAMGEQLFAEVGRQRGVIEDLHKRARDASEREAGAAQHTAKDALAQVPALVVWQAKHPELFKLAATFDDTLKADPAWKGKTMAERFTKAVEMVVSVRGPSVLDGITPVQNQQKAEAKPQDLQAKAQERLAAALGITSLSDIPGGSAVSQEGGNLGELSDSQLVEKFSGMSEQQILAFMAGAVS